MNDQQLKTVVALITGCECALITMAEHLASLNLLDQEALAKHFDAAAGALDANIQQRETIGFVLRQVASGLRQNAMPDQAAITTLLH